MTRAERAAAKRKNQIRKALKRYRRKQREKKTAAPSVVEQPLVKDPIWADPVPAAPGQTTQPASAPPAAGTRYDPHIEVDKDGNVTVADPAGDAKPEPTEEPKPATRYIRRAARIRVAKGEQGPQRGGESAASWGQGRGPTSVPVNWDRDPWEN